MNIKTNGLDLASLTTKKKPLLAPIIAAKQRQQMKKDSLSDASTNVRIPTIKNQILNAGNVTSNNMEYSFRSTNHSPFICESGGENTLMAG